MGGRVELRRWFTTLKDGPCLDKYHHSIAFARCLEEYQKGCNPFKIEAQRGAAFDAMCLLTSCMSGTLLLLLLIAPACKPWLTIWQLLQQHQQCLISQGLGSNTSAAKQVVYTAPCFHVYMTCQIFVSWRQAL